MIKRLMDIVISALGLILALPILVTVAVAIRLTLGAPVLFRQQRPGLNGKPFTLVKFRTMRGELDKFGNVLRESERITTLGRFLRRASLDELPELWNVLVGHMSIVGPRPLLVEYLPLYSTEQARRHEVRPGITGWAQVNGRNAISWDQKFTYDLWYVDHWTISLDLKILMMTVLKVFRAEGINQTEQVTMEKFRGSR